MSMEKTEQEIEMEMQAAVADFQELGAAPERASFEELVATPGGVGADLPIKALYDLNLPITIELGRTTLTIQEVLQLGRGSVIELDRLAGEPVDIFVGDRRFAEGEVVVLGENFGVRITRLVPPSGVAEA